MDSRVNKLPPLTAEDIERINRLGTATETAFDVFAPGPEAAGCNALAYTCAYMTYSELDDEQWEAMWKQKDTTLRQIERKTKKPTKKQLDSIRKKVVELGKKQNTKTKQYNKTKVINYYPL